MLEKYGLNRREAPNFCLVQVTTIEDAGQSREYYLEDDECPLAIVMNHTQSQSRGKQLITFYLSLLKEIPS